MQNAGLDESQARIEIVRRSIKNLRYADDITLKAESEKKLKSLLRRVKEESEEGVLKLNIKKTKNRSPAQVGCMRQVLRAGALGRPRGKGWGGRREGGSGWGTHVNPWLIHVSVWQKPPQYCKVISLQLIKINRKKKQY